MIGTAFYTNRKRHRTGAVQELCQAENSRSVLESASPLALWDFFPSSCAFHLPLRSEQ